ncbi:hypothetical protein AB0I54_42000 [Streptomyces sp. NPDC050625]|uniref:hypothetical protein n=1 Tax=Streptomyces sp. NPDC050625 TaxID=3154629 RepID=UPI00342BC37D
MKIICRSAGTVLWLPLRLRQRAVYDPSPCRFAGDRGEDVGMSDLERIAPRRSKLDTLAEELTKRLQEVEAEREELGIAERVLRRHRDWIPTECPGSTARLGMKAIRADVARLLKFAGR